MRDPLCPGAITRSNAMGRKIQILFVDDEVDFVSYMSKRMELHNLEVHSYTNPIEAFEK